jgi:hypothetical protein
MGGYRELPLRAEIETNATFARRAKGYQNPSAVTNTASQCKS